VVVVLFYLCIMDEVIVNKVSESGLITLDLEDYYPKEETAAFDMKDHLFMGLILKEKEFREQMKALDLTPYKNKNISLTCTADAIIPMWAYMLAASYLEPVDNEVVFGDDDFLLQTIFLKNIFKACEKCRKTLKSFSVFYLTLFPFIGGLIFFHYYFPF